MIEQADGHYKGTLRTVSIKADIDILTNIQKNSDNPHEFTWWLKVSGSVLPEPAKAKRSTRNM